MDKVISVSLAACIVHECLNLIVVLVIEVETIDDVFTNGAREQDGLLLDDCNLVVVPLGVKILQVASIEENFAFFGVIEAFDKRDDGRLAAAARTTERNNSVLLILNLK